MNLFFCVSSIPPCVLSKFEAVSVQRKRVSLCAGQTRSRPALPSMMACRLGQHPVPGKLVFLVGTGRDHDPEEHPRLWPWGSDAHWLDRHKTRSPSDRVVPLGLAVLFVADMYRHFCLWVCHPPGALNS